MLSTMKVTVGFACALFLCLKTGESRKIAFDSATILQDLLLLAADTTVAPYVCPGKGNYPVPGQECTNAYYSCGSGTPVLSYCSGISVFEPTTQICTSMAPCKSTTIQTTPTATVKTSTESTSAETPTTSTTIQTTPSATVKTSTESTSAETPTTGESSTDNYDQSTTESTIITKSTTTTAVTNNTESTPFFCPGSQSNGIYPNSSNCKTFYMCSNGTPYLYDCPSNLVFNPATGNCDYGENVSGTCGSAL